MKSYLYRVVIVEYPKGARTLSEYGGEYTNYSWQPEGWSADEEYVQRMRSDRFFWPSTDREYKSRSGAVARKKLIESFGARCIIQRSAPIVWPADGQEKVT